MFLAGLASIVDVVGDQPLVSLEPGNHESAPV
jgi:hypothetical protein